MRELVSTGTVVRAPLAVPALYDTTVTHVRRSPFRHSFAYGGYAWLVDLDALPSLPRGLRWLARFETRDHVGDPGLSLRANVDRLLASHGLAADRVLMLAHPRALGHVFNPLSVFWCLDPRDDLVATVAEVHNTYGGRHAYLLRPGETSVAKAFYVSPFHRVEGHYVLRLPLPDGHLHLDVTYHRPEGDPFVATLRGTRTAATTRDVVRAALRHPLATRLVSLRIRVQGVRLFLRRLPVVPRPAPRPAPRPSPCPEERT